MNDPVFFCNDHHGTSRIIVRRASDFPEGTRPKDALGAGTMVISAPDSERARSWFSAQRVGVTL